MRMRVAAFRSLVSIVPLSLSWGCSADDLGEGEAASQGETAGAEASSTMGVSTSSTTVTGGMTSQGETSTSGSDGSTTGTDTSTSDGETSTSGGETSSTGSGTVSTTSSDAETSDVTSTTDDTSTTTTGTDTGTDESGETGDVEGWAFPDVYGVGNLDDDDQNGSDDWLDAAPPGDDDLSTWVLPAATLALAEGGSVLLTLTGETDNVRVSRDATVLGAGGVTQFEFVPDGADWTFSVEFATYNTLATVEVTRRDAAMVEVESASVELRASPFILNHHLQPAEHVWIVQTNGNSAFVQGYENALGDRLTKISSSDVWIQDEIEFATSLGQGELRLDTVIDSIRDRQLDSYPENQLEGPDVTVRTWGTPGQETTWDSFGNLEASPPVTVGGVDYPLGRIFYGSSNGEGLHVGMAQALAAQKVQKPFEVNSQWLCVGHVDEFTSFVPDASSPKGFKFLYADVPSAYALLDSLPSDHAIPKYVSAHGYGTVGALVGDAGLRQYNEDLQADYLDPILAQFEQELGLTEDDIVRIPSLFESIDDCRSGDALALIPGMINLIVANFPGEAAKVFVADPFFRATNAMPSTDPVIQKFDELLPDELDIVYLDDWNTYHLSRGEVHCGTNVRRTPMAQWWVVAKHLLGA